MCASRHRIGAPVRAETKGSKAYPLDPSHAAIALDDADDREQIFEVVLRAARSFTRYCALLSVHSSELRGRRAVADRDVPSIAALRIPRKAVPAFEAAIESRAPSVTSLASGEPFIDGLLEQLGGPTEAALVLPIAIATRTVALIVAHRGADPLALADVVDLFPLMAASSAALGRVLARTKLPPRASTPPPGYDVEIIVSGADQQREVIAKLREAQAWEELADALRAYLDRGADDGGPDEDEQLELMLELGHVEADRLGRADRAIEAWRSAQTLDASDTRVLLALQALFVQQGRWLECSEVLEKRIVLVEDAPTRITLLLELAAIANERLDDADAAIAAYERVLHWEPEHDTATRELEALYATRQQWEALAALLLDRASRRQDTEQAVVALEAVAQMYEDKVGDLRAAFLVWVTVVRRQPDRPHLVEQLARLAAAANAWDELLAEGQALAEELETSQPAVAALVWQLVATWSKDHASDPALTVHALASAAELETDPQRRSELRGELGMVYEQLGDIASAVTFLEQALADEPESPPVLEALHRLYRQTEAWGPLAELVPRLVGVHDAPSERDRLLALHVEHGDLLADRLGRPDDAIAAFQAALAIDPKHAPALAGVTRVYRETGQTEALLEAREAQVDVSEGDDRGERYRELAEAWHRRGRFDRAGACWQKLATIDGVNVAARRGIVEALRAGEQWQAMVEALRELGDVVDDKLALAAVQLDLAAILESKLDNVDGAIEAYQAALGLDPNQNAALAALAALYERAGKPKHELETLRRLLEHTTDPHARADVFQRLGQAHLAVRDLDAASLHLEQALALDLDHPGAHEGMARLHLARGQLAAAVEELLRAGELAAADTDKIRLFTDAAWVLRHRLRDSERARQLLHLILELAPDNADAKQALAELLQDTKQWESLWPHLEQQVADAKANTGAPASDRADVFARAARCAIELDNFDTALELYDQACALDPSPALFVERAEALYRSKALEAAVASFHTIVLRFAQGLERDQLVAVYRRLAELHTLLGKHAQAQLFHHKALELDANDRITLGALAELNAARGRFDEAITSLRTLLPLVETDERGRLLERIGDLYRDKLKNVPRAMSTYIEALELDRGNRRVLQRLLDLQSAAGNWKAAVETVDRFLEHEQDPVKRAAYHLAAAEIRRNELKDRPGALAAYELALDDLFREQPLTDATRMRGLETFQVVDTLATADKNWKYQEQSYRRMIKRLPNEDPALQALWHALGETYRTRLKLYQSAIEAFEVAHSLDAQKSPARASILAELYALRGADASGVTRRAAKLVAVDPDNPDAYRALERTALEAGRVDEAWCCARALVFLKKAGVGEQTLYKRY
jgi:golgin subfamily B member 1